MITISIGKYKLQGSNRQELLGLKREIFNQSIYYCDLKKSNPTIIDAGAHVGISTVYFKQLWPESHITAIEPLPQNAASLRQNMWENQFKNVTILEKAISTQEGVTAFFYDQSSDEWFSTASLQAGAWDKTQTSNQTRVSTITLDSLLTKSVDLLKLDIEGVEGDVLRQSKLLHHVETIIVELHPPNTPEDIKKIFKKTHNVEIRNHHYDLKLCYITKK